MQTSETLTKIAPALVAALGKIEGAAKKAKNPAFKSVYANLESVIDASRDALTKAGLCVLQGPGDVADGKLTLTTRIIHTSGEWIETAFQMPLGKTDPQGAGCALTYARRYALMSMLNMPAVDDDAEAATGRHNPQAANGGEHITQDQADELQAMIEGVGADRGKFLAYFKVAKIADIPASQYERAVAALNKKRAA